MKTPPVVDKPVWSPDESVVQQPSAPEQDLGFVYKQKLPHKWLNWFWKRTSTWVNWLIDVVTEMEATEDVTIQLDTKEDFTLMMETLSRLRFNNYNYQINAVGYRGEVGDVISLKNIQGSGSITFTGFTDLKNIEIQSVENKVLFLGASLTLAGSLQTLSVKSSYVEFHNNSLTIKSAAGPNQKIVGRLVKVDKSSYLYVQTAKLDASYATGENPLKYLCSILNGSRAEMFDAPQVLSGGSPAGNAGLAVFEVDAFSLLKSPKINMDGQDIYYIDVAAVNYDSVEGNFNLTNQVRRASAVNIIGKIRRVNTSLNINFNNGSMSSAGKYEFYRIDGAGSITLKNVFLDDKARMSLIRVNPTVYISGIMQITNKAGETPLRITDVKKLSAPDPITVYIDASADNKAVNITNSDVFMVALAVSAEHAVTYNQSVYLENTRAMICGISSAIQAGGAIPGRVMSQHLSQTTVLTGVINPPGAAPEVHSTVSVLIHRDVSLDTQVNIAGELGQEIRIY